MACSEQTADLRLLGGVLSSHPKTPSSCYPSACGGCHSVASSADVIKKSERGAVHVLVAWLMGYVGGLRTSSPGMVSLDS